MSVRDYEKIVTVTNGLTNEVRQVDYTLTGMGLFNIHIKDYLLLQEIKNCVVNNTPCYINFGYKKR